MEKKPIVDFHCHILPGIDDGASDDNTALQMIEMAVHSGTTVINATPHVIEGDWLPEWNLIVEKSHQLEKSARLNGFNVKIYPGAEVALNMNVLDLIDGPGPYCINGGKYILVELPATHIPPFADEFLFLLQTKGIIPVLAHPERHPEIARKPQILNEWVSRGVLVQMNAPSISGKLGKRIKKTAELLLKSNLVHVIGSDAHGIHNRKPVLKAEVEIIRALVGSEKTNQIVTDNPGKILVGDEVERGVSTLLDAKKTGLWQVIKRRFCAN